MTTSNPSSLTPSSLTWLRRRPERGHYDRTTIDSILDAGLVAHVGFIRQGRPAVIPTLYARRGDAVLLHGSPASAMLRAAKAGADLCVEVTHLDGLVLARSAFHHSANYRSAVIYGQGRWLTGEEKIAALDAIVNKIVPGRSSHLRPMTAKEVAGSAVVAVPLDQASAKVRSGPPVDDEADVRLPIWAGVVPIRQLRGDPIGDPANPEGLAVPDHVRNLTW